MLTACTLPRCKKSVVYFSAVFDYGARSEVTRVTLERGHMQYRDDEARMLFTKYSYDAILQTVCIGVNGITLADYLSLLDEKEEETIDILSEDFEDSGRYQNVKNPVATTWLISFEQIRRYDPLAAEYLSFMACIDSRDIP